MAAITIGQQGTLNNELLTVVSANENTFKCDNGKTYLVSKSTWMTNPEMVVAKPKAKKATKVRDLTEEEKLHLEHLKATGNSMQAIMNRSTNNYRAGRAGLSHMTE
ncbi:MAG: hypothetical protein WC319_09935 [Candidatus Paceibacterota bacterium]|jgi:hypothetical protein